MPRTNEPRPTLPADPRALARAAALLLLLLAGPAAAAGVDEVGCIGSTVSDLARARDFYVQVLGFRPDGEWEEVGPELEHRTGVFAARTRTARLALGTECLELTEYLAQKGRPVPVDARSNDRDFQHVAIVVSDIIPPNELAGPAADLGYRTPPRIHSDDSNRSIRLRSI